MENRRSLVELNPIEAMEVSMRLVPIQSTFAKEVFSLAKELNVDDVELYKLGSTSLFKSVFDETFINKIVPKIREEIEKDDN